MAARTARFPRWPFLGVALTLAGACERGSPPASAVSVRDAATVSAELAQKIEQHEVRVRMKPSDAVEHATLGLVYEANGLWSEAASCYARAAELQPGEPLWPLHRALASKAAGEPDAALEILRTAGARFPDSAPLQNQLGEALFEVDELAGAAAAFERAAAAAPEAAEPRAGLGEVQLRRGDPAAAVRSLEAALQRDPEYKLPHYVLAQAYRDLGREPEARVQFAMGQNARRLRLSDRWDAQKHLYIAGSGPRLARATELVELGRLDEAITILKELTERDPDDIRAWINLSSAYLKAGRADDTRVALRRCLEIDRERFEPYINLASFLQRVGRTEEALQAIDRAIELAPDLAPPHAMRGKILISLGRHDEAYGSLGVASRYDKTSPKLYEQLGDVCTELGRHDEAKEHYLRLKRMAPYLWQACARLALTCATLDEWEEAERYLQEARRIAPDEPGVLQVSQELDERRAKR